MAQRKRTDDGARRQAIEVALTALLARYRVPAGFDADRAGAFVEAVAVALDRRLPSAPIGPLAEAMERICERVAEAHEGHDWPTLPVFLRAADREARGVAGVAPQSFSPEDPARLYAQRMACGEAVPETFLRSLEADRAVSVGLIPAAVLASYRRGLGRGVAR